MRTVHDILADLAPRHPHERVRRAVELARDMGPKRRRSLLTELAAAEPYCRHLAVTMAAATGERDHVVAALGDAYPSVRRHALDATDLPDDAFPALVEDGALADRSRLYAGAGVTRWPTGSCRRSAGDGATPRRPACCRRAPRRPWPTLCPQWRTP